MEQALHGIEISWLRQVVRIIDRTGRELSIPQTLLGPPNYYRCYKTWIESYMPENLAQEIVKSVKISGNGVERSKL